MRNIAKNETINSNMNPKTQKTKSKEKLLIWLTIIITAVNFLLVIGFFIFLWFWIKSR